jgi:hypothetical protein
MSHQRLSKLLKLTCLPTKNYDRLPTTKQRWFHAVFTSLHSLVELQTTKIINYRSKEIYLTSGIVLISLSWAVSRNQTQMMSTNAIGHDREIHICCTTQRSNHFLPVFGQFVIVYGQSSQWSMNAAWCLWNTVWSPEYAHRLSTRGFGSFRLNWALSSASRPVYFRWCMGFAQS